MGSQIKLLKLSILNPFLATKQEKSETTFTIRNWVSKQRMAGFLSSPLAKQCAKWRRNTDDLGTLKDDMSTV